MKDFTRGKISAYFNYSLVQKLAGKTRQDREVILSKFVGEDMERSTFIKHYDSLASSSEWNRSKLASFWLRKKDRSIEDMTVVLPLVADEYTKSGIVSDWLEKPERTREDFVAVLPLFADEYNKSNIVSTWLEKPERTREDFVAVLPLFADERTKSDIASTWLAKAERTKIASTWLAKAERTREDFVAVLPLFDDEYTKSNIISTWLAKPERTREDLVAVLPLFADESTKSNIVSTWLSKPERTREDLVAVLSVFADERTKSNIISTWLAKPERTREDFVAVLPLFADERTKSNLAKTWLRGQQNPDIAYSAFVEFVKQDLFCSRYNTEAISLAYSQLPSLPALINKIPDLCKDLYPTNERYQAMLFGDCVAGQNQDILTANKPALKSFIQGLSEDEFALESFRALGARITIPPLEVLEISKNRFNVKYESIREALSNASREEAFDIAAERSLAAQFGADVSQASLCDIFAYYDFQGLLEEFMSILRPEFKERIANEFSPSDKSPYISREEFAKLQILSPGIDLPEVGILGSFLNTEIGNRIPSNPLTTEQIAAFQFGKSNVLEELFLEVEQESKEDSLVINPILESLTTKFRELLIAENPEVRDVANFFAEVLNIKDVFGYADHDGLEKREKQIKLTDFFKGNKILVAHLLAKDNGLDEIREVIQDIGAGCVANIATQFKSAVYRVALGKNFNLAALYGTFRDKISVPILNSGGDHLGGSIEGTDIFTHSLIAGSRISPNGLLKALAEEFLVDGKQTMNSSETILQALGDENRSEITEKILSEFPEDFNQKFAEVAAYCALKPIHGLSENRYFSDLREFVEESCKGTNQPPSPSAVGALSANSITANSPFPPPPPGRY